VRTLVDSDSALERKTALVAKELGRYRIDIAGLSETHLLGCSQLTESTSGFTFLWSGRPEGERRQSGVGFAVSRRMIDLITGPPQNFSDRIMSVRIKITNTQHASFIVAYAPTLPSEDEAKERFYEELQSACSKVPAGDKLFVVGDFNARVGREHSAWPGVLGHHGVGNENSNGTLLLSFCTQNQLVITNTLFQQSDKRKTTWRHPRSGHWHLLDYVLTRQRDVGDFCITRVLRGAELYSDHRLVRSKLRIRITYRQKRLQRPTRHRLNVENFKDPSVQGRYRSTLERLINSSGTVGAQPPQQAWSVLKNSIISAANSVTAPAARQHRDWFDQNDSEINSLLTSLRQKQHAWLQNRADTDLHADFSRTRRIVQSSLRHMKTRWWEDKAKRLQSAADSHDMKAFYSELRAVYGPSTVPPPKIYDSSGTELLSDRAEVLKRWSEHFNSVYNCESTADLAYIDSLAALPTIRELSLPPDYMEILTAVRQLKNGKASGPDGIPAECLSAAGPTIVEPLTALFRSVWQHEELPPEFRDADIVHIYKRKGDIHHCDNHRGIALLSAAGKVFARVLLNRLLKHVTDKILPESQCGFRSERSTTDMIFSVRQLQEKCREQQQSLFLVFVDLTKAFDSVNRSAMYTILSKLGCPEKFVKMIRLLHDGMMASVLDQGDKSDPFSINNGVKQGCVLAPTLFSIVFSVLLRVAFKDSDEGVLIKYRYDGGAFNIRRLKTSSKTLQTLLRDFLYADDAALADTSLAGVQRLTDRFAAACRTFGFTISIKKTEVLYQPAPYVTIAPADIQVKVNDNVLQNTDKFCYLGSLISQKIHIDDEITRRIGAAAAAFGRLETRLWRDRGISSRTKVAVYRAVVVTTLLYAAETWTFYSRHIRKLNKHHLRWLRHILGISWKDRVSNLEVLQRADTEDIEAQIIRSQLRWTGHTIRMENNRIPKILFYGELAHGKRAQGGQFKRYKDNIKHHLQEGGTDITRWELVASDRVGWRALIKKSVSKISQKRAQQTRDRKERRIAAATAVPAAVFICAICSKPCKSRIGLLSHSRSHTRKTKEKPAGLTMHSR
jgi:Reverse transcriptase (RNA-dependent DNA polymerase)/Endonuclease/Exonuclease/phosphatase family